MLEFLILSIGMLSAFLMGHLFGYENGRLSAESKARKVKLKNKKTLQGPDPTPYKSDHIVSLRQYRDALVKQKMINQLSRNTLTYDPKSKNWIKVYDAEIVKD